MADGEGGDGWAVVAKKPKAKPKSKPAAAAPEGTSGAGGGKGLPLRQQQQQKQKGAAAPRQPQPPPARNKTAPQQQPSDAAVEDTAVRIGGLSVAAAAAEGDVGADGPALASTPTAGAEEEGAAVAQPSEAPATAPAPAPAPAPTPKKQFSSWAAMAKDNVPAPPPTPAPASAAPPTMNGDGAAAHTATTTTTPAATAPSSAPWGLSSTTTPGAAASQAGGAAPEERRPTVEEVVDLLAGTEASTTAATAAASSLSLRQRGLVNSGNACFRNVILQALLACTPFHALLRRLRPLVLLHPPPHLRADPATAQREAELCALIPTWLSLARLATALEDPGLVASDALPPPVVLNGKGGSKKAPAQPKQQPQPHQQQRHVGGGPGFVPPLTPDDYLGACFAAFRSSEAGEQQDPHDFSSFLLSRLHEEAAQAMRAREAWVSGAGGGAEGQEPLRGPSQQQQEEEEDDGWQEVGTKGTVARLRVSGVEQGGGGAGGGKGGGGGGEGRFEASAVTRIFYGRQRSDLRRSTASKNVSATVQPCESLQVEVAGPAAAAGARTLEEALAGAFAEETIAVTAPGSRSSGLKKRMLLDALPPVLVLQLKRFAFDPQRLQPIKICKPVEYPHTLTLPGAYLSPALRAAHCSQQEQGDGPRYALFAVVLHHGRTVTGGHYTAYCRGSQGAAAVRGGGGWFVYDDERVEEASEAQARRNAEQAYLFFYVRVEGAAGAGGGGGGK